MRTPEEVAREAYAAAEQTYDALREFGPKMSPGEVRERMIHAIATHLRARDAEVREDALAGLKWVYETSFEETGPCMSDERDQHYGTEYVTSECYFPFAKETRHLQGPREPVPTTTDTRESTS